MFYQKKIFTIILFILFITATINSKDNSENQNNLTSNTELISLFYDDAQIKDYFISFGEMICTNLLIYDFNALILQGSPTITSFNIFLDNLKSPWIWDYSGFGRNQIIHPYIGASYFLSGRSNNLNFWESFLLSITGSFLWESYFEGPIASKNDFITTPTSGAIIGEMLHRLSFSIYDNSPLLSWIISPYDALTQLLRGKRGITPKGSIYETSLLVSTGLYSTLEKSFSLNQLNLYYPSIGFESKTIYGNPYSHKTKEFLDQFTLCIGITGAINNYQLFYLNCDGTLISIPYFTKSQNLQNTIGISTNYDIYKSNDLLLSNSALGITNKNHFDINTKSQLNNNFELNFIYLSSADNYYLLSKKINQKNKQTNYTFKYGPQIKIDLSYSKKDFINIFINFESEFLINYKNSSIENSFESNALIFIIKYGIEKSINKDLYIGIQDLLYIKNDYIKNDEIESTKQVSNFATLYFKYYF